MRTLGLLFRSDLLFCTRLLQSCTDDSNGLPNDLQDRRHLPSGNSLSQGHLPRRLWLLRDQVCSLHRDRTPLPQSSCNDLLHGPSLLPAGTNLLCSRLRSLRLGRSVQSIWLAVLLQIDPANLKDFVETYRAVMARYVLPSFRSREKLPQFV